MNLESRLLSLPHGARHALSAVSCLASFEGRGYSMVEQIAQRGVSSSYLAKILQLLARKGVLSSRRGARGGYRLARPAARLYLAEVVRAAGLEENRPPQCMIEARACGGAAPCALHREVERAERSWWRRLQKMTVAQLAQGNQLRRVHGQG